MLSQLLKNNNIILQKTGSYLLPMLDRLTVLVELFEKNAGDDYLTAFACQELHKGDYLLKAGTVCSHIWFLEKGIAREYAFSDCKKVTECFFFPSEIIDTFWCTWLQLPSFSSIQLLEDAKVYSISKCQLNALEVTYPQLSEILKIVNQCYASWLKERVYNMMCMEAYDYYQHMLCKQPYLVQHVSLNHIASYLGIQRETLSRLRSSKKVHV